MSTIIETERLNLRNWQADDLSNMINLAGNPEVMRYFPRPLTAEGAKELLTALSLHQEQYGYTYFAAEVKDTAEFIGFIGIKKQTYESHFTPCVDVGWRLLPTAWGKGYATEGAKACLDFGFSQVQLAEIYAVCPAINKASEKVMQRIGMTHEDTFRHVNLAEDSPLNPCALYKVTKGEWEENKHK